MIEKEFTTGSFEEAIQGVVREILCNEVSTFFPAQIQAANTVDGVTTVDVISSIAFYDDYEKKEKAKEMVNVPILLPNSTNSFIMRPPLDSDSLVGSYVGIVVSQSYFQNWLEVGGNTVLPNDSRRFHYSDAVAILGFFPNTKKWSTLATDKKAEIKVTEGNSIEVGNDNSNFVLNESNEISLETENSFIKIDSTEKISIGKTDAEICGLLKDLVEILSLSPYNDSQAVPCTINPSITSSNGNTFSKILTALGTIANNHPSL